MWIRNNNGMTLIAFPPSDPIAASARVQYTIAPATCQRAGERPAWATECPWCGTPNCTGTPCDYS